MTLFDLCATHPWSALALLGLSSIAGILALWGFKPVTITIIKGETKGNP